MGPTGPLKPQPPYKIRPCDHTWGSVQCITAHACQSKTFDVVVPAFDHMFKDWTSYASNCRLLLTVMSRTQVQLAVPALVLPVTRGRAKTEVLSVLHDLKAAAKTTTFAEIAISLCGTEYQAHSLLRDCVWSLCAFLDHPDQRERGATQSRA